MGYGQSEQGSGASGRSKLRKLRLDAEDVRAEHYRPRQRSFFWRSLGFLSGALIVWAFLYLLPPLFRGSTSNKTTQPVSTRIKPPGMPSSARASKQVEKAGYSGAIQELMDYVEALREGRAAFSWAIDGEEAAKQLRYSRLFASAYEEVILHAKAHLNRQGQVSIHDIVRDFGSILREEQEIDKLFRHRERHAAAIAFLRGMQNGDLVFPGPRPTAPIPETLLVQLASAYPEATFDINDPVFAKLYRQTREFAATKAEKDGGIWAYEVIAEFRRLIIVELALAPQSAQSATVCNATKMLDAISSIASACPHLRISENAKDAATTLAERGDPYDCRRLLLIGAARERLNNEDFVKLCQSIALDVQGKKISVLQLSNK